MSNLVSHLPAPYVGMAKDALGIETGFGTLTLLNPGKTAPGSPYCAVFPGYTGDATTHERFNNAMLTRGVRVLCITPKWSNSTGRTRTNALSLMAHAHHLGIEDAQPYFVRGVSFGADLSLAWLTNRREQPKRLAWITPCSAAKLLYAGKSMGLSVVDDSEALQWSTRSPIWLQALADDAIVPVIDQVFLKASPETRVTSLHGSDHFEAGNLADASDAVATWFQEAL